MWRIVRVMGPVDARGVGRDGLLRWILLLPLALALAARWLLPALLAEMETLLGLALLPYYRPVMGYVLATLAPFMVGFVVGFLLLDQRDDRTLVALQVTPLPLSGYLAYRLALPLLVSVPVTMLVLPVSGLAALTAVQLLLVAVAAAPQAPLLALLLAALAQNKVQGFALLKASSVVMLPPLLAYFLPPPWPLLLGIVPTVWPARLFWALQAGDPAGLLLAAALAYQGLLLLALARAFRRVMTR
ncbi:MAG: hypothetical protein KC425_20340 [Anaerolineales bacterium]|nr:hypothetical protein [Anaerolineales bacterium]